MTETEDQRKRREREEGLARRRRAALYAKKRNLAVPPSWNKNLSGDTETTKPSIDLVGNSKAEVRRAPPAQNNLPVPHTDELRGRRVVSDRSTNKPAQILSREGPTQPLPAAAGVAKPGKSADTPGEAQGIPAQNDLPVPVLADARSSIGAGGEARESTTGSRPGKPVTAQDSRGGQNCPTCAKRRKIKAEKMRRYREKVRNRTP